MAAAARLDTRSLVLTLAGLLLSGLAVAPAWASFIPLDNQSVCFSRAMAGPVYEEYLNEADHSPDWFWAGQARTDADFSPLGEAMGEMGLYTDIYNDSCMVMSADGNALAFGSVPYWTSGYSEGWLLFMVTQTQEYIGNVGINIKQLTGSSHYVELTDVRKTPYWHYDTGNVQIFGRIAPGSYWFHGKTNYAQTPESGQVSEFAGHLCISACNTPLINQQPADKTVAPGATIECVLTFNSPPPSITRAQAVTTFQWRKNLQNLADGGRISGVTSAHLVIANAAYADTGLYDCVVTQGTIVEPSREALVKIGSTTAVDPPLAVSELRLTAPRPNPFVGRTRMEFELARAGRVSLVVYDALGRRVKELVPGTSMAAGRYAIDWNGTDAEGRRVAGGVYFVHLLADGTRRLQRAVLMPGGR